MVYKWNDANGVVHYSDQSVPGAEKILTGSTTGRNGASSPTASAPAAAAKARPVAVPKKAATTLNYLQFAIAAPTPEQTFNGGEAVTIRLELEPRLKRNHAITWHLNGKTLEDQGEDAVLFTLENLDRGSYSLFATIADQSTGETRNSEAVNFYVRQSGLLSPLRKKPAG